MRKIRAKRMFKNALVLMMCVCVGTAFSFSFGTESVSAVSKPGKVKSLSAKAKSYQSVYLSWSKASKASGYQIVRNGKQVCKTKSRSYTNTKLKGSTTYSYKVRAYKTYTQKRYYNKKTKKWQKKKPARKYRGGTKRVTLYRYGSYSPARTVRTPAAPISAPAPQPDTPKIPGENDTEQTFAVAEPVIDDTPKETTAQAPAVANADDPEKIKPTHAKATDPSISLTEIQDLTIKAKSRNIQLSWTAQTNATGYQIFRAENSSDTPKLIFTSTIPKYCDIEEITTGKTYYYQVRAYKTINSNATYYSKKTEKQSATVPQSSADNEHIYITDTGVTLSWDEPTLTQTEIRQKILSDLADEYSIDSGWEITTKGYFYGISRDGSWKKDVDTTSYVDTSVTDGGTYSYKIKKNIRYVAVCENRNIVHNGEVLLALDTFNNVYFEKGADGFTNSEASYPVKLAPPRGFEANGNYDNVALSWSKNEEAAGYQIYRGETLINTISGNTVCSYKDKNVEPETTYTYTIKATNEKGGTSAVASTLTIKTPAKPSFLPPSDFNAKAIYNSVDLKWTANPVADKYKIYRNDTLIATMASTETEYIDGATAVKPETKYTYSICSVKGTDESVRSSLTITTPKSPLLIPPENIKATGNYDNVALSWIINEAADSYNIYRNDVKVANVPGVQAGYVDTGLTPRTIYTYAVTSVVDGKESVKATFKIATPAKPDMPFDELKNVTLSYGNATIHLGQKWTSNLESELAAGASGTDTVTRTNFIDKDLTDADSNLVIAHYTLNEDVYMFDTGDYDKFLAVYVAGGQIIKWTTNMSNMGSENGTALTRGTTGLPSHGQATMKNRLSSGAWCYNGISYNGVFIGGFQVETIYTTNNWSRNVAGEKRIGMHFINAYRYLLGSQPLSYSNAIDGGNNICTKTYTTSGEKQYTNSRYGAQAFAETCSASKQCIHNTTLCKEGPLAGQGSGTRHGITCLATGEVVIGENVGTGALGECCLTVYADSVLHLQAIYNPDFTKIGIGFGDMSYAVHAEQFAK